jgi:hypothetical protein
MNLLPMIKVKKYEKHWIESNQGNEGYILSGLSKQIKQRRGSYQSLNIIEEVAPKIRNNLQ